MSSVIGHGLSGILCRKCFRTTLSIQKERAMLSLSVFLAILPDFDVIVFMLLRPAGMTPHRGLSHSILFAAGVALLTMMVTRKHFQISKIKLFLIYLCPILSHLLLDFLMGAGPPVPFFAPFYDHGFLCPVRLVPCAYYSLSPAGLAGLLFHGPTLMGIALELLIFAPLIKFMEIPRNLPGGPRMRKLCLVVSALALLVTFYLYNGNIR